MSWLSENLLGILVAVVILLVTLRVWKKLRYFSERSLPNLTTVWDLLRALKITTMNDLPQEFYWRNRSGDNHPMVGIIFPNLMPALVVTDPDLVQSIFIKDFSHFHDHAMGDFDVENNPLGGHLFNMKGDHWRTLRHKLVPTFTSGKLRGMVPIMEECADNLLNDMQSDIKLRQDTNLKDLYKRYSLAVIASCAFGIDPRSVEDSECDFNKMLQRTVSPTFKDYSKFMIFFYLPFVMKLLKIKLFDQEMETFYLSLTKETFKMRKESGTKRNDFMQLLLELKEKGSVQVDSKDLEQDEKEALKKLESDASVAQLEFTDELLMAQVFVFLVAGFENTAYIISLTTYYLSKYPEIQERVRQEMKQAVANHSGTMDYSALREMQLLEACINESLRLHPALPVISRECNKNYTLKNGSKIEKGTMLIIPVEALQKDDKYWREPKQFDPDRFLGGEIRPGTYMPFGDGPRICIAQRLALLTSKLILAKLLTKYRLLPSSKMKEPIEIKSFIGIDAIGGFWGNFESIAVS